MLENEVRSTSREEKSIVLKLSVEDVRTGLRNSARWCPLALSAKRSILLSQKTDVTKEKLRVMYSDGSKEVYDLSPVARQFVDFFDKGSPRKMLEDVFDGEEFLLVLEEGASWTP